MRQPFSVYCDWALHDELGDQILLTEEMTMGVLDTLERWQRAHGVSFDYYLLDAFWYEKPGDYQAFNPEMWPDGFGPARRRMEALGMKPGLWFDTTGGQMHDYGPWQPSKDVHTGYTFCLFDGPYADGLLSAMLHAASEWGVRLFKFDFANFYGVTERFRDLDAGEAYRRNTVAFSEMLREVRKRFPDVLYLAYNGFVHVPDYIENTTGALVPGVSPAWLGTMDYVYSGDPRPADTPCTSLRRAVDIYQDHMNCKFRHRGIPPACIDDHGCMVGNTNTIYYLGKRGWRRTWVQTLARGSRKAHLYGDVHLLDDDDVRFLGAARSLFFDLYAQGAESRIVGGVPCWAPWHGYLAGSGADGLAVLVNATAEAQDVRVELPDATRARVLFHDEGFVPECSAERGTLSARLAPEQMVLIGLGEKAQDALDLGENVGGDPVTPASRCLDLRFHEGKGRAAATIAASTVTEPADAEGLDVLRLSFRLRDKGNAYRRAFRYDEVPADALRVELGADGRAVEPVKVVPDVKIWSGCSWITALYRVADLAGARRLSIRFTCRDETPRIIAEAYLEKRPDLAQRHGRGQ